MPFKFRRRISLGPAFHDIRRHGPATVANLPRELKLFPPRKLLRKPRYIQRQPVHLLVREKIRIPSHHARTLGHFLYFLYFLCFLNFLCCPLTRRFSPLRLSFLARS